MSDARLETFVKVAMGVREHHQMQLGRLVLQHRYLSLQFEVFLLQEGCTHRDLLFLLAPDVARSFRRVVVLASTLPIGSILQDQAF